MFAISDHYIELLNAFLDAGYQFKTFEAGKPVDDSKCEIFLRHDIDFDCDIALKMAEKEAKLGVKSHYFFLLRSDAFNLLSQSNSENVMEIKRLGHDVSLHFDPTLYNKPEAGLAEEIHIFEQLFKKKVDLISIHRPQKSYIRQTESSLGVEHLYQAKYLNDITYLSESGGRFRFGHPLESVAFNSKRAINLLIHPIWWIDWQGENLERLNWLAEKHRIDYVEMLKANCIPYRDLMDRAQDVG